MTALPYARNALAFALFGSLGCGGNLAANPTDPVEGLPSRPIALTGPTNNPHSLAILDGRIYWALEFTASGASSGEVHSVSSIGGDARIVASGLSQPRLVVSDSTGINRVEDRADGGTQLVRWTEAGGIETRFAETRLLTYFAVDDNDVYAVIAPVAAGDPATLERWSAATVNGQVVDTWPGGGSVSVNTTDVYWGYGRRVPKSGAPAHSLTGGVQPVTGMRNAEGAVYLALCEFGAPEGDILRIDVNTEAVTKLTTLPGCSADFAYSNGTLYAVTGNGDFQAPSGGLFAIDVATGEYRTLVANANDPIQLVQDDEALYWAEFIPGGRIMKWVK